MLYSTQQRLLAILTIVCIFIGVIFVIFIFRLRVTGAGEGDLLHIHSREVWQVMCQIKTILCIYFLKVSLY